MVGRNNNTPDKFGDLSTEMMTGETNVLIESHKRYTECPHGESTQAIE